MDRAEILWRSDPAVQASKQQGDAKAEQEAQHAAEDRVPGDLRRGRRRGGGSFLGDLDSAVSQFGENPERLRTALQDASRCAGPLLAGERAQLLVDALQRGGVVRAAALLLLGHKLAGVGVRDLRR